MARRSRDLTGRISNFSDDTPGSIAAAVVGLGHQERRFPSPEKQHGYSTTYGSSHDGVGER
jgi:hypothetical protein